MKQLQLSKTSKYKKFNKNEEIVGIQLEAWYEKKRFVMFHKTLLKSDFQKENNLKLEFALLLKFYYTKTMKKQNILGKNNEKHMKLKI